MVVETCERSQTPFSRPAFHGRLGHVPGHQGGDYGAFIAINPNRTNRPAPQSGQCPLCRLHASESAIDELEYKELRYWIVPNGRPIVKGQGMIIPISSPGSPHRCQMAAMDVEIACLVAREGFGRLSTRPLDKKESFLDSSPQGQWAVYVNPVEGSGRSLQHLHLNVVPARSIPLPPLRASRGLVCDGTAGAKVYEAEGVPFHSLLIRGPNVLAVAATVQEVAKSVAYHSHPYNLAIFPRQGLEAKRGECEIMMIPRVAEYSPLADQKIGGLELMAGILLPGDAARTLMTAERRDAAFRQVTLSKADFRELHAQLRSDFGTTWAGHRLVARSATQKEHSDVRKKVLT